MTFGKYRKVLLNWPTDGTSGGTACWQRQSLDKCHLGAASLYLVEGKKVKAVIYSLIPPEKMAYRIHSAFILYGKAGEICHAECSACG